MLTPLLLNLKHINQERFNSARLIRSYFLRLETALHEFGTMEDAIEVEQRVASLIENGNYFEFKRWVQYYERELYRKYVTRNKK